MSLLEAHRRAWPVRRVADQDSHALQMVSAVSSDLMTPEALKSLAEAVSAAVQQLGELAKSGELEAALGSTQESYQHIALIVSRCFQVSMPATSTSHSSPVMPSLDTLLRCRQLVPLEAASACTSRSACGALPARMSHK